MAGDATPAAGRRTARWHVIGALAQPDQPQGRQRPLRRRPWAPGVDEGSSRGLRDVRFIRLKFW